MASPSFVVRRTFLDMPAQGIHEDLPVGRPRADTDSCIDYSFSESAGSKCKEGRLSEDQSTRATSVGDEQSWSADASDCGSWASEMELENEVSQAEVSEPAPVAVMCPPGSFMMMFAMPPAAMPMMQAYQAACPAEPQAPATTTLVLRKLPKELSSVQVRRMLDSAEFRGLYDFLYVPVDFKSGKNLGYALVNFESAELAASAQECFHGARMGRNALVCELSRKHTGLSSLVEQYQGSHVVTDDSVPEEHKPMLLRDGEVIPFPVVVKVAETESDCEAEVDGEH